MKKRFILAATAIALAAILIPVGALAADEEIFRADFSETTGAVPEGWSFSTANGTIDPDEDGVAISLEEDGFALLTRTITLEPQTAYRITLDVETREVWGSDIGANVNIQHQYADARQAIGTDAHLLELYVQTNVDTQQDYILRAGLGNETEPVNGTAVLRSLTITRIDELPEGIAYYSLIGSMGLTGSSSGSSYESEQDTNASAASYNDIGIILFFLLFTFALYLLFTSKWAPRLSKRLSGFYGVLAIFIAAFLIRVYMSGRFEGHITDLGNFKAWALNLQDYGLSGFYESGIFADYPPAYMYVLYAIGGVARALNLDFYSTAFNLLIELPAIFCDLGIALFAFFFIAKRKGKEYGALAAFFILVCPAVLTDSVVWGQIDSIFTLTIIAVAWLIYTDKKYLAGPTIMLAFLIKPQAVMFLPVLAIVFIVDLITKGKTAKTLRDLGIAIVGAVVVYAALSLPMRGTQGFFYVFERMLDTATQYGYATANAFNLWGLLGANYVPDTEGILGVSFRTLGIFFIVLSTVAILVYYLKKRDKKDIFIMMGIYSLMIFILAHYMHERYSYPAMLLLVIAAFERNSRKLLLAASGIAALLYANMYTVLIFRAELVYPWLTVLLSALYVAAFGWALYSFFRDFYRGREIRSIMPIPASETPSMREAANAAAKKRLLTAPHTSRRMRGRDWLIMLIVTAIYGAVALTNLGSLVIPSEAPATDDGAGSFLVLELDQEYRIGQMKYYTGYCEGDFDISVSTDGVSYFSASEQSKEHNFANMFRWQMVNIGGSAKYVKLTQTGGYLEFREIAFFDEDNHILPLLSAALTDENGVETDAYYALDEQDQAPEQTSYMTEMYFDEIYHARTAYEYLNGIYPYEITHPPLGKSIITLGIRIFGMNPFGWRFMGALCGILMLPVLYIFAKRVFKSTLWASAATLLLAADFMHFSLTRIATIDSYTLFFILLMYLCMYEYTQHSFFNEKLSRSLLPLGLCGAFFALGAATKWISLYAGLGLAVIFFYTVYQRCMEYRALKAENDRRARLFSSGLISTLIFCVAVFILLPLAVYVISYLPYEHTASGGFGLRGIIDNQKYMFNYHGYLTTDAPHPYSSSAFSWPFDIRPVYFFSSDGLPSSMRAVIWCMGNPLIWWGALAAIMFLTAKRDIAGRRQIDLKGFTFVAVAALCQFFPNVLITREMFIYHYFSLTPFLIMGIVFVMRYLYDNYRYGRVACIAYAVLCCAVFAAFYPVITGTPVSLVYGRMLQWFSTWPM